MFSWIESTPCPYDIFMIFDENKSFLKCWQCPWVWAQDWWKEVKQFFAPSNIKIIKSFIFWFEFNDNIKILVKSAHSKK